MDTLCEELVKVLYHAPGVGFTVRSEESPLRVQDIASGKQLLVSVGPGDELSPSSKVASPTELGSPGLHLCLQLGLPHFLLVLILGP